MKANRNPIVIVLFALLSLPFGAAVVADEEEELAQKQAKAQQVAQERAKLDAAFKRRVADQIARLELQDAETDPAFERRNGTDPLHRMQAARKAARDAAIQAEMNRRALELAHAQEVDAKGEVLVLTGHGIVSTTTEFARKNGTKALDEKRAAEEAPALAAKALAAANEARGVAHDAKMNAEGEHKAELRLLQIEIAELKKRYERNSSGALFDLIQAKENAYYEKRRNGPPVK